VSTEVARLAGVGIGTVFRHFPAKAGAVRDDVELPEVYALLVGAARAAGRGRLDGEARARLCRIVFDGLAPRPAPGPR
jgi:AcrR family transcriptional regulator